MTFKSPVISFFQSCPKASSPLSQECGVAWHSYSINSTGIISACPARNTPCSTFGKGETSHTHLFKVKTATNNVYNLSRFQEYLLMMEYNVQCPLSHVLFRETSNICLFWYCPTGCPFLKRQETRWCPLLTVKLN